MLQEESLCKVCWPEEAGYWNSRCCAITYPGTQYAIQQLDINGTKVFISYTMDYEEQWSNNPSDSTSTSQRSSSGRKEKAVQNVSQRSSATAVRSLQHVFSLSPSPSRMQTPVVAAAPSLETLSRFSTTLKCMRAQDAEATRRNMAFTGKVLLGSPWGKIWLWPLKLFLVHSCLRLSFGQRHRLNLIFSAAILKYYC